MFLTLIDKTQPPSLSLSLSRPPNFSPSSHRSWRRQKQEEEAKKKKSITGTHFSPPLAAVKHTLPGSNSGAARKLFD